MNKEIEKKFYVNKNDILVLDLDNNYEKIKIGQKYIAITNNEEMRVRRKSDGKTDKCYITYKKGNGCIRDECEFEVSKEFANKIWGNINKRPIYKTRYLIPYKGKIIELDVFKNLTLKAVAEIEFDNEEEMDNFEFPEWFEDECEKSNSDLYEDINEGVYDRKLRYS